MKYKVYIIVIVIVFFSSCGLVQNCFAQLNVTDSLYSKALHYIIESEIGQKYLNDKTNISSCHPITKDLRIGVSKKTIKNKPLVCLCSILQQKYKFNGSCTEEIGLNRELSTKVVDSVKNQYANYKSINTTNNIHIKNISAKETGFIVWFSDFYKNSVFVELLFVCVENEELFVTAPSFYFIFDDDGMIKEVYTGEHYYN